MSSKRQCEGASEDDVFVYYEHTDLESIPADITSLRIDGSVKRIPCRAFHEKKSLTNVEYEEGLQLIGDYAFSRCSTLREQQFPSTLIAIGKGAFSGCFGLKNITLPTRGLKQIEERSFQNCTSLTHLWIPPTVECIDRGAFAGCTSLLSVEVPETLKRLTFFAGFDDDTAEEELGKETERCGYESLVNIYIPPSSHQLDDVQSGDFMRGMKLGEAEGNYSELVGKLKRRFNSLPLHRACYFQSYQSLQDSIQKIQSIVQSDKNACEKVDFLGMAPFHILALSQRPRLDLFQELLSVSSSSAADIILYYRDIFGCTPLDYLCKNVRHHSPAALSVTKSLLIQIVKPKISFLGPWGSGLMSDFDKVLQILIVDDGDDDHHHHHEDHHERLVSLLTLGPKVATLCQTLAALE